MINNMHKFPTSILIFFLIIGSFVTSVGAVSALRLVEDSWNTKTPMNQARANLGVVAVEGKIYAIGGYTINNYQGTFVGTNECYDPASDTWTTLEAMPTPRACFAIAEYQGKIYCIGGAIGIDDRPSYMGTAYIPCGVIEVYDPVANSWNTKKPLPFMGSNSQLTINIQAHVVNGQLFFVDNYNECNLYMYEPATDVWVKKSQYTIASNFMPHSFVVTVVIDNQIIITRASYSESVQAFAQKILIYDPKTDVWREGQTDPEGMYRCIGGATTGLYAPKKVYILGVRESSISSPWVANRVYDPVKDIWSTAKDVPTNRRDFGVVVIDDVLYVIGGDNCKGSSCSLNEQYVPIGYHNTSYQSFLTATVRVTIGIVVVFIIVWVIVVSQKKNTANKKG
jgi:N-acetylneuraminic acid mutarotase